MLLVWMIHVALLVEGILSGARWGYPAWRFALSDLPKYATSALAAAQTPAMLLGLLSIGAACAAAVPADWKRLFATWLLWSTGSAATIATAWHLAAAV
jgi:hypothetical protein